MSGHSATYIISVLAPDRRGIIADVSSAVYEHGGNIEAMSQTIMQGWFTMLLSVTFPATVTCEDIQRVLNAAADCSILVRPAVEAASAKPAQGEPYVLTVVGDDKPGIVRALSRCCADKGVNIDDVWNEVRNASFITVFHVKVPQDVDPREFRYDLEQAAEGLGVNLTLQHQDIFTATNSLQVHTRK